jgi:Helix-turn-helix of DDE superfamily endonuclease
MKNHRQSYASISNDQSHQALTGLSREAFRELCRYFDCSWRARIGAFTLAGKPRRRPPAKKRSDVLPTSEDKLFLILKFCKTNPLQEELAHDFAMPQSHVNTWIHVLLPVLSATLYRMRQAPKRETQYLNEILEAYEHTVIDVTERPRERPDDMAAQKSAYSGKKKHIPKKILS